MPPTTTQQAQRRLGSRCRDHGEPVRVAHAWVCPTCSALISDRDVTGEPYPESLPARTARKRQELMAETADALKTKSNAARSRYRRSVRGRDALSKAGIEAAVKRYPKRAQIARALGVHTSSLVRAAKRHGVAIPTK